MAAEIRPNRENRKYLWLFLKGMAMGAADSVPGVSGGTIAVISRIYDELIYSIRSIDAQAFRLLLSEGPGRAWHYINGTFLLVLACGILLSLRLSAGIVLVLMERHFEALMAFFIGLVLASSWSLRLEFGGLRWRGAALLLAGMVVTLLVSTLSPVRAEISNGYLFVCGVLAICAMILPGLSGAFLLLLLGVYDHVLAALVELDVVTILVFGGGCGFGLLAFSRLLSWTLANYRDLSYAFLTGMLLASVYVLWPWQQVARFYQDPEGEIHVLQTVKVLPGGYQAATGEDPEYLVVLLCLILGITIIAGFDKLIRASLD